MGFSQKGWLLTVVLCLLAGCGKEQKQHKRPPRVVSAAVVEQATVPHYIDTIGSTTAYEFVEVMPQVDGELIRIAFQQGTMVNAGDLLFEIDPRTYQAQLEQAQGDLIRAQAERRSAQAQLKINELELERTRPLLAQQLVSAQDFQQLEATVAEGIANIEALEGSIITAEGAVAAAKVNLGFTQIPAPVSGMVGTYQVNVGNVLSTLQPPVLTTIRQLDPIYADFIVPESKFALLHKYFVQAGGELVIEVAALGDEAIKRPGKLTVLGNSVNTSTGTVSLRAIMDNKDHYFWPNQPIRVRIILEMLKDALVLPSEALGVGQQGQYVFIIEDNGTVKQQKVTVGQEQAGDKTVILAGLQAGERVVRRGQVFLFSGMAVTISHTHAQSPDHSSAAPADESSAKKAAMAPSVSAKAKAKGEANHSVEPTDAEAAKPASADSAPATAQQNSPSAS